jgi:hypothetical protein
MDAEGGENIDLMTGMFGALIHDAQERNIPFSPYYDFDEDALLGFKKFQGLESELQFYGSSIEQTYAIWCQTPRQMLEAVLGSVGVKLPSDYIQDSQITFFNSPDGDGDVMYVRFIPPSPVKPTKI